MFQTSSELTSGKVELACHEPLHCRLRCLLLYNFLLTHGALDSSIRLHEASTQERYFPWCAEGAFLKALP